MRRWQGEGVDGWMMGRWAGAPVEVTLPGITTCNLPTKVGRQGSYTLKYSQGLGRSEVILIAISHMKTPWSVFSKPSTTARPAFERPLVPVCARYVCACEVRLNEAYTSL